MSQCPGKWVLTNFYEAEQAEASFFILGTALHETIEVAINMDLDLDWALKHMNAGLDRELERIDGKVVLESSKRGVDTMRDDAERMLGNWFKFVHPDSDKRLEIYDEYDWPPQTEVAWDRWGNDMTTKYPVWGSADAIFTRKGTPKNNWTSKHGAIVDWKSGSSKQRNSDQLHFYIFGIAGGWGPPQAWFHHLDRVQKRSIIQMADPYPGDAHVRQRIVSTEAIKDSIIEGEYPRFNPDWYCGYCPVQQYCPADGDYRNRETNAVNLRRMLKLARPMKDIERKAS